jgi:hypothetical protein
VRCRDAAVALLTLAIALAGCSTYAASRYVASADTGRLCARAAARGPGPSARSWRRFRISAR